MIVQVRVVLKRTVVSDSGWHFDNLSGSHHQSQVKVWKSINLFSRPGKIIENIEIKSGKKLKEVWSFFHSIKSA